MIISKEQKIELTEMAIDKIPARLIEGAAFRKYILDSEIFQKLENNPNCKSEAILKRAAYLMIDASITLDIAHKHIEINGEKSVDFQSILDCDKNEERVQIYINLNKIYARLVEIAYS